MNRSNRSSRSNLSLNVRDNESPAPNQQNRPVVPPVVPPPAHPQNQAPVVPPPAPVVQQLYPALPIMVYTPPASLSRAKLSTFVRGSELRPVLETIVRIRYSVKTQRDTALQQLDNLLSRSYDLDNRAPDDDVLIDTTVSAAADFLTKIYTGLDIGEREGEVNNNMDDKKLSVVKSSQELLKIMLQATPARAATYGIYNQAEFERRYALVWQ
ncbi:coat protein [Erysiphe necator associated virga-like virus 1]|nr:coat protein [Erysiphe necator associated virga-like virus 1]